MDATATNPRETIGGNRPDYAKEVTERLTQDYADFDLTLAEVLDEARGLPKEVADDADQGRVASVIKRIRDLFDRFEALRVAEKEPFLRGGTAVDTFFKGRQAKLAADPKSRNASPGAADVLQKRVNAYVQRKADEERRRREEEARLARAAEDRARREREEAEQRRRDEEGRAARARKDETEAAALQRAAEADAEAKRLRDEEERARATRQDAEAAATSKTADLVRTRTDEGHMVTARQVPYVEITDRMQLNFELLKPFFKDDHVLAALKSWARTTQHRQPMPGAIIEMRDEAVIR